MRHLFATAALQEGALIRYLKAYASPLANTHESGSLHVASWHLAHTALPAPRSPSLMLKLGEGLIRCQSSVVPAVSHLGHGKRGTESSKKGRRLLAESLPPLDELLRISEQPATHGCLSPSFCTPAAVRACAAQKATCVRGHPDSSFVNNPAAIQRQRSGDHEEEGNVMDEVAVNSFSALPSASHVRQKVGVSQPGFMLRTMLVCEGIAINSLFDHGRSTCRV
jgi:hypothetical protein